MDRDLESPSIKILLFLFDKGEVRYSDLTELIKSRGNLSANLKDLDEDELIKRRIVATKPIPAYYSLTEKGKEVAKRSMKLGLYVAVIESKTKNNF